MAYIETKMFQCNDADRN